MVAVKKKFEPHVIESQRPNGIPEADDF